MKSLSKKASLSVFVFSIIVLSAQGTLLAMLKDQGPGSASTNKEYALVDKQEHMTGQEPYYAPGEIIIKFKDDAAVGAVAEQIVASGQSFHAVTLDDNLDRLNNKYKVKKMHRLFKRFLAGDIPISGPITPQQAKDKLEQDKQKYNQRIGRIKQSLSQRRQFVVDRKIPYLGNIYRVELDTEENIERICAEYEKDPYVEYAQPNYLMEAFMVPNDPFYSTSGSWGQSYDDLWGLKKIQTEQAWDITQGEGVVVAVVDTGLDYDHPDIALNTWANPAEIPGNNIDDDKNGYIDDIIGWDFFNNDNDPLDGHGHGTHVSGTIAAIGNNGIGIIGVAPKAKIMPLKGLSDSGSGYTSGLAEAIVYAAENGADVINNSWGCGYCPVDPVAEDAVRTAYGLGVVVVFAAGNSSDDVMVRSPQNMTNPKPVVVAASTELDEPTFFTSYGILIDVAGPGGGTDSPPPETDPFRNILSLKSATCDPLMCPSSLVVETNYVRQAGTSMAAPHVTGLAALVVASRPLWTVDEVRQAIRAGADDIGPMGPDLQTGAGRINAESTLAINSVLVPQARITAPMNGKVFVASQTPILTITGTAAGNGFQAYELFFKSVVETEWTMLQPAVVIPVVDGMLGQWDIGNLAGGSYWLRLSVTSTEGFRFEEIVLVFIDKGLPSRRLTIEPRHDMFPHISGDRVTYQRQGLSPLGFRADYFVYDLVTDVRQQLTANLSLDQMMGSMGDLSGSQVIWRDHAGLILHDLEAGSWRLFPLASGWYGEAQVSSRYVIWTEPPSSDVVVYDLTTEQERRIPSPSVGPTGAFGTLDLEGQWLAFTASCVTQPYDYAVYLYDLATDSQMKLNQDGCADSVVSVSTRGVAWIDVNGSLMFYDFATHAVRQLAGSLGFAELHGFSSSDTLVAWIEFTSAKGYIVKAYDFLSDTVQPISGFPSTKGFGFDVLDRRVAWADDRDYGDNPLHNYDIYIAEVPPPDGNQAPLLNSIGTKTVGEGQLLQFTLMGSDPDGDSLTYSATVLPAGSTFNAETQTFSWTPSPGQAARYWVTFTVSDGSLTDSEIVTFTVMNTNQPPVLDPIGNRNVKEDQTLTFSLSATDPDGQPLTFSTASLPAGATFNAATRTFSWTPGFDQANDQGPFNDNVLFTVSDGNLTDSELVVLTVTNVNQPPVLAAIGAKTVLTRQLLQFTVSATDPDPQNLTYSASPLPAGAMFNTVTQTFSWTPTAAQVGSFEVTFAVSDGSLSDSELVTITVIEDPATVQTPWKTNENGTLGANQLWNYTMGYHFIPGKNGQVTKLGGYFNGTKSVSLWNKSTGALLAQASVTSSNAWSYVPITPVAVQAGQTYTVAVSLGGSGGSYRSSILAFPRTYGDITIQASTYIAGSSRPTNSMTTAMYGQADIGFVPDSEGSNQAPVLDPIGNKTVNEGSLLQFAISASDPDGDTLAYSASNLPSGANFNASTRTFSWIPNFSQAGTYSSVHFEVSDGKGGIDSEDITITVNNVPQIPNAPSGLSASAISSSQINLSWLDNSTNETGFKIERKTGAAGTYFQIATVGADITTYSNTGLAADTTYYYRVRAYNSDGDSNYSNEANATTQTQVTTPAAPTNLTAQALSATSVKLTWSDNSTNETGFKIERRLSTQSTYSQIATVGINTTTYTDIGLSGNKTYYYRVMAYNSAGNSAYSNTASARTPKK